MSCIFSSHAITLSLPRGAATTRVQCQDAAEGTKMARELNFKLPAFPTTKPGLLFSPLSVSLSFALMHKHTRVEFLSPTFHRQRIPTSPSFISAVQRGLAKELLHFRDHAGGQCVFLDCIPDGRFRTRCLPWDTHVGSCFPSFFFGHQVSLCFSGHGNLSSKHILSNTKIKNIPTRSLPAIVTLVSYTHVTPILHILMACVLLAKGGCGIRL